MRTLRGLLGLCTLLGIAAAVGCGGGGRGLVAVEEDTPTAEAPSTAPSFANASTYLHIPTYEGSGQVVHPDIAYFPDARAIDDKLAMMLARHPRIKGVYAWLMGQEDPAVWRVLHRRLE